MSFVYNGLSYMAVITKMEKHISVYLPDEDLHYLVPGGRLLYEPGKGWNTEGVVLSRAQRLLLALSKALESEIVTIEAS